MRFASDSGFQIIFRASNGQAGRWITNVSEIVKMAMRTASLTFRSCAKQCSDFCVAFDVSLICEAQVTTIGLAFTRKGGFKIVVGFRMLPL